MILHDQGSKDEILGLLPQSVSLDESELFIFFKMSFVNWFQIWSDRLIQWKLDYATEAIMVSIKARFGSRMVECKYIQLTKQQNGCGRPLLS